MIITVSALATDISVIIVVTYTFRITANIVIIISPLSLI